MQAMIKKHHDEIEGCAVAYFLENDCTWPEEVWATRPMTTGEDEQIGTGPRPKNVRLITYRFGYLNQVTVPGIH